ncbi:MAG: transposase, partial [Halanaerobium sp.]
MNSIIPHKIFNAKEIDTGISSFFKKIMLGKLLRKSNIVKLKGASCLVVFKFIFTLIFTGKNLYQLLESKNFELPFEKDVVYDFLNSASYNWRKFLLLLSSWTIKNKLSPLTSDDRKNVLIFDDSVYSRSRSKVVELLAKVRDHATGKYVKGLRLLTMGWSDGNSFIPAAFALLSSKKDKNRINGINEYIDKRTNGYKRRKEALKKSTEVMFDLLESALKYSLPVDYVLFDSWFAFPKIIKKVLSYDLEVVCRLKAMYRVYYKYKGKKLNLKQLYNTVKKNKAKHRVAASVIISLGEDNKGNEIKAKIVFIRDDNNKNKWIALLSTDTSLKDKEIIRIYGKRWDIEVFFKMNKSYLRLAKEFQGRNYDMMFAHTTIVFTRYIMLTMEVRKSQDSRTFGGIFFEFCDELDDLRFIEALFLIIDLFKKTLDDCLKITEQKINQLLDYFFGLLPNYIKKPLKILNSES